MKKFFILYLIFSWGILFAQDQSNNSATYLKRPRAMWVWNNNNSINNIVNNVDFTREELYDFCRNPHGNQDHEIKVLFWGCKDALFGTKQNLYNFLADAHDNELTIEYLDGDPTWATYNQDVGFDRIKRVLEFNAAASSEDKKFDGIQFDVEPYLLKADRGYQPPYWDKDRDSVWALYVAYMDSCQRMIDRADSSLYFGIAIPRWYENHVGNSELFRLQSVVDYVAIMDYNENPSVIIRDAENEISNASTLNKKVWIGVETKDVEPETVTFYEEGVSLMEEALTDVVAAYEDNPVFSGIAIHAYYYYKSLPITSSVGTHETDTPHMELYQNTENPVRFNTTIKFQLQHETAVEVAIFNALGQKITTLYNGVKSSGVHEILWNPSGFSTGIYFYQLRTAEKVLTKKMLILR